MEDTDKKRWLMAKLAHAPAIDLANRRVWNDACTQALGNVHVLAFVTFAECWARLMQLELAQGNKLKKVWQTTSDEANYMGLSGSQYNAAMRLLVASWAHGPKLLQLHNAKFGVGTASGIVNPDSFTV